MSDSGEQIAGESTGSDSAAQEGEGIVADAPQPPHRHASAGPRPVTTIADVRRCLRIEHLVAPELAVKAPLVLIMPSFRSAGLTLATVAKLRERNPGFGFHVLVVDSGGEDGMALQRGWPEGVPWSLVVLMQNLGGAGASAAGQEVALEAGYRVLSLVDNDAELIERDGLRRLVEALGDYDMVAPSNPSWTGAPSNDSPPNWAVPFHYLTMRAQTVRQLGLVDPAYFLRGDDLEYTLRARARGLGLVVLSTLSYEHPPQKPGIFSNDAAYTIWRNHVMIVVGYCQGIRWDDRLKVVSYLAAYFVMKLIHCVQTRDLSILEALGQATLDAVLRRMRTVKPARWHYEPVTEPAISADRPEDSSRDLARPANRLFLRRWYFTRQGSEPARWFRFVWDES